MLCILSRTGGVHSRSLYLTDRLRLAKAIRFILSLSLSLMFCAPPALAQGRAAQANRAAASSAYTNGRAAQLNAGQITRLLALRAPIAVPTYLPPGFVLRDVEAEREESRQDGAIINYSLRYVAPDGREATIHSGNEGLGDLPLTQVRTIRNQFLSHPIYLGRREEQENPNRPEIDTQWIKHNPRYTRELYARRGRQYDQHYRLGAIGLSFAEAARIVASLRYLSR